MAKDDTEEKPKKKRSKLKWLLLIIFILLILGGGAAGAWIFFLADMFKGGGDAAGGGHAAPQATDAGTAPQPIGTTIALPVFTVNLADPLGQRFIKISIEVEVADTKAAQAMDQQKARIRDSIIMLLSSKSYADIASTESKMMLKGEITSRLNAILGSGKVYQVFITDMVIQ